MKQLTLNHSVGQTLIFIQEDYDFKSFLNSIASLKIALIDENLFVILSTTKPDFLKLFDSIITIPEGENSKSFDQYIIIIDRLFQLKADRSTYLFAIGGGVTGDLTGFVASTFLRGVSYIQIPTTLLSQIDSSIGGKTGINHPSGKNLIGSIYQPKFIIIDPSFLKTLPEREVISALGEMVKYTLLNSAEKFDELKNYLSENSPRSLLTYDFDKLTEWIEYCVKIKTQIVEIDEHEKNVRAILNLGHTLGHAVEKHYGYENIRHGEAVSVGMLFVSYLAMHLERISKDQFEQIYFCLKSILPFSPFTVDWNEDKIFGYLLKDKKNQSGSLKWIMPKRIGECEIVELSNFDLIKSTIRQFHYEFLKWH